MDDSCQDFEDICSKLLKRVRKNQGEPRQQRREEKQPSSQASHGAKRSVKKACTSGSRGTIAEPFCAAVEADLEVVGGGPGFKCGDAGKAEGQLAAKDKVLQRMQKFKRASPQKIVHWDNVQTLDADCAAAPTLMKQNAGPPQSSGSDRPLGPVDGDEALAKRLQQELDREAMQARAADLMDGGLFFCHICHKDLSHMTPEGRTQHVNRCLDESEGSASVPPPPPPSSSAVPDCPICGKKFKSLKSHSAHLKRCSSDMGVSPAELLQALHRQAEERQNGLSANTLSTETAGTKRKGSSRPGLPAKKPRKKAEVLDEQTLVALALSSSLCEQEGPSERAAPAETTSQMWMSHTGKGRGKKKKGAVPRPPPLLLVQDAAAALTRLQERVSALLLRNRPTSPPTPTRCPSTVPGWSGAAPLWQKSSLLEGLSTQQPDLYTHELRAFFTLSEKDQVASSINRSASSDGPAHEGSVVTTSNSTLPPSQTAASSTATEELPVSTQVFRDLMELAEDGMVLSQGSHSASCCDGADVNRSLRASGFVEEELEDQAGLCSRGFLPQMAFSRLRSDLDGMVNNPQLSDVQLQVDTGEVFFAHSFMLYARCPLLAEMVHESGFGVQEEGMPAAQRVLVPDVPAQAVVALLQYLYTAHPIIPSWLRLHVLELASRFDLKQLQQLCELTQKQATSQGREEDAKRGCEDGAVSWDDAESQKDQAFLDLLRSMWNQEDDDNEAVDADERQDGGKAAEEENGLSAAGGEACEENVNEEELEEIYQFAATQRQRKEEAGSTQEQQEADGGEREVTKLPQPGRSSRRHLNCRNASPALGSDPGPARSSPSAEPLGVCDEGDLLFFCSAQLPQTPEAKRCRSFSPQRSAAGRTLLQSSASVGEDLSPSSPPIRSFLPVPGETPDRQQNRDPEEGVTPKQEGRGPHRLTFDLSPGRLPDKQEAEVIVLSDSDSPSPTGSPAPENVETYTRITPHPGEARVERSQDGPADCSPELSWLVPSTPLQRSRSTSSSSTSSSSTSSSSTQTRSSVCRTQLFPSGDAAAAAFSPPRGDGGATQALPHNGSAEGGVGRTLPHSSTPLHPHVPQPHGGLHTPPNSRSFDRHRLKSKGSARKPSGRTETGSSHSSPPSGPSGCPSSRLHSGFQDSQRDAGRPCQGQGSRKVLERDMPVDGAAHEREGGNEGAFDEEPHEEAAPSGLHQSSMDLGEPPMAFNDSWGLDTCTDAHAGCFSLRLEDSSACSQLEPPHTHLDAPPPTSETGPPPPSHGLSPRPSQAQTHPSPRASIGRPPPQPSTGLLDSHVWDSWEEEEDEVLPLSQRAKPSAGLKTPAASCQRRRRRRSLVAITPMPHYSDMDTPELKSKLTRFGVRPLPKCQMILKLKEIHRYTHQLASSDSEDEGRSVSHTARIKPSSVAAGDGQHPCAQPVTFQAPGIPPSTSPLKESREEQMELLSASQGSNTSSTAASEESERSNPELVPSSDGDSDSDSSIPASQAASRLQDRLQAVRAFILSDSQLYTQILEYRPLVLSHFQGQLKAAGIRLGVSRLAEYLDSQCITFTTAKPGQPAACRGRGKRAARRPVLVGERGPSRRKGVPATG